MSEESFEKLKNEMSDTRNEMRTVTAIMGEEFARLHAEIREVDKSVEKNNKDIRATRNDLTTFIIRFEAFVSQVEQENNLTHAQGEVVILNQEIEKKFGIYDKVRKVLLGILQSVDTGLVSKNAITCATERLMLGTPRYWLTPSLIAIAAWLNNDKQLALKGLNEGLKRNLMKTELMFTLVNNRLKRSNASFIWLSKYFENQNPLEMPQETLILLGAYTDGIFGPDSQGICKKQIEKWIDFLSKDEERVKSLENIWVNKIDLLEVDNENEIPFKYLTTNCEEWNNIKTLLNNVQKQNSFLKYLKEIIETQDKKGDYIKDLDDLLFKLVNDYDEDEYELKKKKRLAELVIKHNGDKEKAQQDFETNAIILFSNKVSFFDILVNSVNQAGQLPVSPALRKLSLLLMKKWILNAHNDFTVRYRATYPKLITLKIDKWSGTTKDGSNVKELVQSFDEYLKNTCNEIMKMHRKPVLIRGAIFLCCCIWMLFSSFSGFSIFVSFIVGCALVKAIINYFISKANLKLAYETDYANGNKIINGCCAEFVDWQKMYSNSDKISVEIAKTLNNYTSADFSDNSASNKVITKI